MDHRKHAARSRERMKGYASGGGVVDPGEIENRGPNVPHPGPGAGSYRGSKYEKDDNAHGRRVYEPMGEDTGISAAGTHNWGYKGRKSGGRV